MTLMAAGGCTGRHGVPGNTLIRHVATMLSTPRFLPVLLAIRVSSRRELIHADLRRWMSVRGYTGTEGYAMRYLLVFKKEFRSLVYWRLGRIGHLLRVFAAPAPTLTLGMDPRRVGPGLYIQHGEGSFVAAHSIGSNGWINQQVTIGFINSVDCPTIGDDVTIHAGAKVLGDVTVGNGVTIGVNAVVLRSLPSGATAVAPPARVIS